MCQNPNPNPKGRSSEPTPIPPTRREEQARDLALKLSHGGSADRVQAARDIRRLARASAKARSAFAVAAVLQPLVSMLPSSDPDARDSALLALLNLAVRNQRNKEEIVKRGAIPHLVALLKADNINLRELATAAILTLSASTANKPTIASSGAVPLLVQILISGSVQGKVDAVTALYNLSTCNESPNLNLSVEAVKPLLTLLKDCKKYSKLAEKATALLEILSESREGRCSISEIDGGILTLVETVEEGSLLSTEHAVGVLFSLCRNCRSKYRDLILKEGPIPGLMLLTVDGSKKAQERAHNLLELLRDDSRAKRVASEELETMVYDIATRVDGPEKAGEAAKRLLQDMVQRNMETSMTRLQHRAASCKPKASLT